MYGQYEDQKVLTIVQKKAAPDCIAEATTTFNIWAIKSGGIIEVDVVILFKEYPLLINKPLPMLSLRENSR